MLPEQLFVNHGGGMVAVSSQYSTVAVVVLLTLTTVLRLLIVVLPLPTVTQYYALLTKSHGK